MSTPDLPPYENSSSTYILDAESTAEMARLIRLDQMTTKAMGKPLADVAALPEKARVLDIACGPGGWVLDLAFLHPEMEVVGIDISHIMISYANVRAASQHIRNVSFGVMDVTKPLDFSDHSFDLINGRLLSSFLPRDSWATLLQECQRILRPGGILRITETDHGGITTSPAFDQLNQLLFRAMRHLGYGFSPQGTTLCITPMLERLFAQSGYTHIEHQAHAVNFSAEAEAWADFYRNTEIVFDGALKMLQHMEPAPSQDMQALYNRMLVEMQQEDFCGMWYLLSVWGKTRM
ncbi:class I SAM-dependent methyltransferase [Ktedonobacteria bacterium brp13]|nr:class I SAM-dependent methyltransferase [Ktedonobacteria bacterium brp13]